MPRGDLMGAALDSTAGLIKLIAMLHFQSRDQELALLITGSNCDWTPSDVRRDRKKLAGKDDDAPVSGGVGHSAAGGAGEGDGG